VVRRARGCADVLLAGERLSYRGRQYRFRASVAYGQLEFGNTATDLPANEFANGYCYSWWLVPAITGDKITIDWTSEPDANGAYLTALWAYLYPVGTTDFNFPNTNPVAEKDVNYAVTGLQEL
jgi:hypothetical protein